MREGRIDGTATLFDLPLNNGCAARSFAIS